VQQAPELDTAAAPTTPSFPCRPQTPGGAEDLRTGLVAGAVAGIISGAPSTLHALVTGGDPLKATLAAGSLLLPRAQRTFTLLAAALPVHLALSVGWAVRRWWRHRRARDHPGPARPAAHRRYTGRRSRPSPPDERHRVDRPTNPRTHHVDTRAILA